MLQRLVSGCLAPADPPTVDLYLLNACGDIPAGRLRRLAPTVFAAPDATLVMRHDFGLARAVSGRLVFFTDDDVETGPSDPALGPGYRLKLRLVERASERRLVAAVSAVVVSSQELAHRWQRRLPGVPVFQIDPYWSSTLADLEHFAPLMAGQGWLEMAYLGSLVHAFDLAWLWPVVAELLERHPRLRFHFSARHRIPPQLRGHPRIRPIPARSWPEWRAALEGRRFHLALYPLLDTPFNRARSVNKVIEHAVVGAAPVYSACWPEAARVRAAAAGRVLANDRRDWFETLSGLISRPAELHALAAAGRALARRLNRPEPQRGLWQRLLGAGDAATP